MARPMKVESGFVMTSVDTASLAKQVAAQVVETLRKEGIPAKGHAVEKVLLSPGEFGERVGGVSDWYILRQIKLGVIKAVKVGNRYRIPIAEVDRYASTREAV
jgi:excisionase family DNA binding protein